MGTPKRGSIMLAECLEKSVFGKLACLEKNMLVSLEKSNTVCCEISVFGSLSVFGCLERAQ
jgi:hypothetical protein